jgi:hypothetical protein
MDFSLQSWARLGSYLLSATVLPDPTCDIIERAEALLKPACLSDQCSSGPLINDLESGR